MKSKDNEVAGSASVEIETNTTTSNPERVRHESNPFRVERNFPKLPRVVAAFQRAGLKLANALGVFIYINRRICFTPIVIVIHFQ